MVLVTSETAVALHPRMSSEDALDAEYVRRIGSFNTARRVCLDLAEFLEYDRLPVPDRTRYVRQSGRDPQLHLATGVNNMVLRVLCDHGTERQAFNFLQADGIVVDQRFEKTRNLGATSQASYLEPQASAMVRSVQDGVQVDLNNLAVYPKDPSSLEVPGMYSGHVTLTVDIGRIQAAAESYAAEVRAVEDERARILPKYAT